MMVTNIFAASRGQTMATAAPRAKIGPPSGATTIDPMTVAAESDERPSVAIPPDNNNMTKKALNQRGSLSRNTRCRTSARSLTSRRCRNHNPCTSHLSEASGPRTSAMVSSNVCSSRFKGICIFLRHGHILCLIQKQLMGSETRPFPTKPW